MSGRTLAPVDDVIIDRHFKGFAPESLGRSVSELCGRLSLAHGDFVTPVLLLQQDVLQHNVRTMQSYCDASGLSLSPHAKTTMSPEIMTRQLAAGAWAVTVATCTQAAVVRSLPVERVLIANELVDPIGIEWLGSELDRDDRFTGYCYVDSADGVRILDETLAARGQQRSLPVLIEFGVASGRAGVRSIEAALLLAGMVRDSRHLRLAGVAGFEGIVGSGFEVSRLDEVVDYLHTLRDVADELFDDYREDSDELLVTAGGSGFFELVAETFDPSWRAGRPIRVVLRSGCYVTHDSGGYAQVRKLLAQHHEALSFTPALELWSRVISRPEPDLAILDFGKRDAGTDAGLPVPRHRLRRGTTIIEPAPAATVFAVNDQHAYLRANVSATENATFDLDVGDLVGLGISHPCTTLDKWRLIPIVDSDRRLVGAAHTLF